MSRLVDLWQHIPEHINPAFLEIGSFQLRYYGLMYLVAFSVVYLLVVHRIRNEQFEYSEETIQDYFVWAIAALLIGARLGYVLFYNLEYYAAHPLAIVFPFDISDGFRFVGISGLSYHGGLVGIILVSIPFFRSHEINLWRFADLFCPAIPLGYTFGRIGNFLNGELYGRVTDVWWGMYFPLDPLHALRHPSQLYEAFFEGIFLSAILWIIRKKEYLKGMLFPLYLIGYGTVRFCIEFFRQPDPQVGLVAGVLSMGQMLCLAMIVVGIAVMGIKKRQGGTV
ncbi:MAG: prolipoprotein diacylglyceryl transferase [Deltaproteobacteria bacterium]|nr:prolipoprotein diacylglyceryl transferase [Deltaproteobacteria bacterium]MBW2673906.1 prolipoprotein diacylglyceryl transferase [Deltaproteobacteria bacterium]